MHCVAYSVAEIGLVLTAFLKKDKIISSSFVIKTFIVLSLLSKDRTLFESTSKSLSSKRKARLTKTAILRKQQKLRTDLGEHTKKIQIVD